MTRAAARVAALAAAIAGAGCDRRAPSLDDCSGDLDGLWRADAPAPDGGPRRYHALLGPTSWELFPIFDDASVDVDAAGGPRRAAPAVIELARPTATPAAELTGTWERRYEQGGATCVVATPARAWGCQGHTLHLDVTPPAPPVDLAACVAGPAAPAVTWILRRE